MKMHPVTEQHHKFATILDSFMYELRKHALEQFIEDLNEAREKPGPIDPELARKSIRKAAAKAWAKRVSHPSVAAEFTLRMFDSIDKDLSPKLRRLFKECGYAIEGAVCTLAALFLANFDYWAAGVARFSSISL